MDVLDLKDYRVTYSIGKSRDIHVLFVVASNIVLARDKVFKAHRDGILYPPLSAFLPLKILSINDVSGV